MSDQEVWTLAAREPWKVFGRGPVRPGDGFDCYILGGKHAGQCLPKACHQPQALAAGKGLGEEGRGRRPLWSGMRAGAAWNPSLQVAELLLLSLDPGEDYDTETLLWEPL